MDTLIHTVFWDIGADKLCRMLKGSKKSIRIIGLSLLNVFPMLLAFSSEFYSIIYEKPQAEKSNLSDNDTRHPEK